jgi:sugar phosphate isomerase/epimerase
LNRRRFLKSTLAGAAGAGLASGWRASAAVTGSIPLGLNSYSLRALRWNDFQLIDYAVEHKLDALFLQDSLDPEKNSPEHWAEVRKRAADQGLHLEVASIGAILPKTPDEFPASVKLLEHGIEVAAAMGSPIVRCLHAPDRAHLPPGPMEQHIETSIRLLKAVRTQAMDANVKIAIENHKDLQAWELRQVIEGAGIEFVGSYLDTGNPVFVTEDPMTTLEVLGPYALTVHLRDSVVYETANGAAVQWVPLGEGIIDFKRFIERMRDVCKPVYVYVKPITGRAPQVLPYFEPGYWQSYPKARAADFARFLALAKSGHPYGRPMLEEPSGRAPDALLPAIQYQQRTHMEKSLEYAKQVLGLGIRSRT